MQGAVPRQGEQPPISADEVRAELERVLQSKAFTNSQRASRFLRFIVERAIQGKADELKEYIVGLEVFDRKETYDPRIDPIVRVEALRLREKLVKYYETDGHEHPVRIELPKRSYAPVFRAAESAPPPQEAPEPRERRESVAPPENPPARRPSRSAIVLASLVVLALLYAGISGWRSRISAAGVVNSPPGQADAASILVLPFRDLSVEQDQEYFSAGLTEELINALTRVPGLRVVPRTSAFRLSNENRERGSLGRELNVSTVLEGSVRRSGDRVRVSVQVSDVAGGHTLWADTYDRALKDVLAVQQEIAHAVISSLRGRIATASKPEPRAPTTNVEAFNLYLKGRYHWNRRTEDSLKKAIAHFTEALKEDPQYAAAYSGLADSYSLLAHRGTLPAGELMPQAKAAALKALAIDDTLAEAHSSLGYVNLFFEWNAAEAERRFQRALELNPQYVPAHQWYAFALMVTGRADEALAHAVQAEKLDPLSPGVLRSVADMHYRMRNYDRAIEKCREALDLDPHFTPAYMFMGRAYVQKRLFPEAIAAFERSASRDDTAIGAAMVAHTYALWRKPSQALQILKDLETPAGRDYVDPFYLSLVYTGLGDQEKALAWLERAFSVRSVWVASLPIDPRFDPLKDHPKYKEMVARLRF